ncbi:putative retrotransposon gag domain, aspartic peptidase domain protein [Tanacetum coccineum]
MIGDCQGGNRGRDKVGRHRGEERGTVLGCYLAGSGDRATEKDVQLFPLYFEVWGMSRKGGSLAAYKTIKEWHEQADLAQASLDKAAKKMKKWADEKRRHVEFKVGDQVMVKLLPQQFKSLRKVHKGLIRRYKGPFPVIGRVGKKVLEGVGRLGRSWKLLEALEASRKSVELYIVARGSKQGRFEAMAIETEKNAASGSTVVDENRGRDDVRQNPKKRGTSKDVVASLDQRVAGVETSMAELKNQVEGLEGLDSDFASMREDFREALNTLSGDLKRELHDLRDSFMGEITKIREEFGEEVSTLHQTIENLQADVALCKRSLASSGSNTNHGPKIDVPKPSPFVGKREARAVDDFLWEMEQYLEGVNMVDDTSKIKMATRYLKDTAALWWRRRYGDIERGTATIDTWAEFVADFKKQFYPENAKNEAKSRLRKLKQSGTIREYVKEFTTLVLEIPELSDQDSLFYFLDGLQGWAKTELERRGVQDLSTAIAHAEALIDFSTRRDSSKPKDKKVNQEKGGGEKNAQPKVDAARKPPTRKDKNLKTSYKSDGCFICDGPHRARDCPKKAVMKNDNPNEWCTNVLEAVHICFRSPSIYVSEA